MPRLARLVIWDSRRSFFLLYRLNSEVQNRYLLGAVPATYTVSRGYTGGVLVSLTQSSPFFAVFLSDPRH